MTFRSLPLRERGLKSSTVSCLLVSPLVAPLAGAWIEIERAPRQLPLHNVAPLAGAWIEISSDGSYVYQLTVAPLAGAWIEMYIAVDC